MADSDIFPSLDGLSKFEFHFFQPNFPETSSDGTTAFNVDHLISPVEMFLFSETGRFPGLTGWNDRRKEKLIFYQDCYDLDSLPKYLIDDIIKVNSLPDKNGNVAFCARLLSLRNNLYESGVITQPNAELAFRHFLGASKAQKKAIIEALVDRNLQFYKSVWTELMKIAPDELLKAARDKTKKYLSKHPEDLETRQRLDEFLQEHHLPACDHTYADMASARKAGGYPVPEGYTDKAAIVGTHHTSSCEHYEYQGRITPLKSVGID